MQDNGRNRLVFQDIPEDCPTRPAVVLVRISSTELNDDLRSLVDHIGQGRCVFICAIRRPKAQGVGEDGGRVFAAFKREKMDAVGQRIEKVLFLHRFDEQGDLFVVGGVF